MPHVPPHPIKLAILDDYQNIAAPYFESLKSAFEITVFNDTLLPFSNPATPDSAKHELVQRLKPFTIISSMRERTPFPDALLSRLPNLKLLLTTGTRNAAIDMPAAKRLGIHVTGTLGNGRTNAKTAKRKGPDSTTQHCVALILGIARNIAHDHAAVQTGGWQTGLATGLSGKTFATLGLGRLGVNVARIMSVAFSMKIVAWSSSLTQDVADEKARAAGLPVEDEDGEKTFKVVSKEELFRSADVLSVHYVLSDRSRGIVGAADLALLKPSALFINTSRGPLVDDDALYDVLQAERIRGAALDVFELEPLPVDSRWRTTEWGRRVLLSPHMGYVEEETIGNWYEEQVEIVERCIMMKSLIRAVIASYPNFKVLDSQNTQTALTLSTANYLVSPQQKLPAPYVLNDEELLYIRILVSRIPSFTLNSTGHSAALGYTLAVHIASKLDQIYESTARDFLENFSIGIHRALLERPVCGYWAPINHGPSDEFDDRLLTQEVRDVEVFACATIDRVQVPTHESVKTFAENLGYEIMTKMECIPWGRINTYQFAQIFYTKLMEQVEPVIKLPVTHEQFKNFDAQMERQNHPQPRIDDERPGFKAVTQTAENDPFGKLIAAREPKPSAETSPSDTPTDDISMLSNDSAPSSPLDISMLSDNSAPSTLDRGIPYPKHNGGHSNTPSEAITQDPAELSDDDESSESEDTPTKVLMPPASNMSKTLAPFSIPAPAAMPPRKPPMSL
ncbi:Glyoxylate reductase [Lachnellula hyalina]|uniref:Glyoxylate reductase n=1 Tax=Lachnellula hyalina TaxID=1316788 RepID=A0A8H8QVS8_9HELO|nr:Glyoxylate reductase [Lachnellula hyalina]TVY23016.1 Glyoxylate reductase [Lachnellula hyalina]